MNWCLKMAPTNEENGDDGASSTPEYRDRLRTWLIKMIESGTIPGLHWENEEKTIFRMPWKHAGRQDYSLEEDSKIFMAWAIHSGRYREGVDKPEPIIWKTRLRCALNKMPDIKEIQERSRLDISEPYRVYQFLPPIHKDTQIRRRTQRRHSQVHSPTSLGQNSRDGSNTSPAYDRNDFMKEDLTEMPPPRPTNFPGFMFQDPSTRRPALHSDYSPRSNFESRGAFPWINSPNFLPSLDRRLLHGLNLSQGLTSPISASSLMNPFGLFSHTQRDPRQRPDYDLPLYPYPLPGGHNPLLSQQGIPNFISSSTSGNLPPPSNPISAPNLLDFTRRLSFAAQQRSQQNSTQHRAKSDESPHHNPTGKHFREDLKKLQLSRRVDVELLQNNPDELVKLSRQLEEELDIVQSVMMSLAEKTGNENLMPGKLYSTKQSESRRKIESLQRELQECKKAQERERNRRKSLEKEQESLKSTLERMGGDLLSLVMSNSGSIETVKNRKNLENSSSAMEYGETNSIASTRRHSADELQNISIEEKSELKSETGVGKCFRRVQSQCYPASCPESSPLTSPGTVDVFAGQEDKKLPNDVTPSSRSANMETKRRADDIRSGLQKGFPLDLTNPPPEKRLKGGSKFFGMAVNHLEYGTECASNNGDPFSIRRDVTKTSYAIEQTVDSRVSTDHVQQRSQSPQRGPSSPVYSSSSTQPEVQSPSTSSSYSSAEESHRCLPSPTSRISPTLALFRSKNPSNYPHYQSNVNGPIQVT